MESNADSDAVVQGAQANEQDPKTKAPTQASAPLVEDLDERLEELQDRMELLDRLMEDFQSLQAIVQDKVLGDRTIESIQQDPSH
ncbi:hypothetical protein COCON_G00019140 [Conger conger]|uniref:Uncharacterized protein n=1 Tax=Conger conger TaxID=82655 RepID=A0A9Q1E407_CONCO|nr:hypothetical protein COCON_G00019140 [Conger conger]